MEVRAREDRCEAFAGTRGRRCGASAAIDKRCWIHGAATLTPAWTLTDSCSGTRVWPTREDTPKRRRPRYAQKWAAIQLVKRGVITRGVFFGGSGERLLRRIEREGVKVVPVRVGALVRVVMFEAPAQPSEAA